MKSLLDVDFDIKEKDLTIGGVFKVRATAGLVMNSPEERLLKKQFNKYCKDFPQDLPHVKGNSFGPAMCERYFIDWLCSLPASYVSDSEFLTSNTMISQALAKIAPDDKFSVRLVNMVGTKTVIFKWASKRGEVPETILYIKLF